MSQLSLLLSRMLLISPSLGWWSSGLPSNNGVFSAQLKCWVNGFSLFLFFFFFPQNLTAVRFWEGKLITINLHYAKQDWSQNPCVSFLVLPLVWKILYINIFKCWCFRLKFRHSTNKSWFFQIETQTHLTWQCFKASLGKTIPALSASPHMKGLPNPWWSLWPFCASDSSKVDTALHMRLSTLLLNYVLTCMK